MENNCLKTQLKSVVNNSNLEKLGYLSMYYDVTSQGNYDLYIQYTDNIPMLEAEDGLTIVKGNGTMYPTISGKGILRYPDKYHLTLYWPCPYSTIEWNSISSAKELVSIGTYYGSIKGLNNLSQLSALPKLSSITIYENEESGHLTGNITDLSALYSTIGSFDLRCITFDCTMSNLGMFSKLSSVKGLNGPGVTGSIEDFVHTRRNNGETSSTATVRFIFPSETITFNGSHITPKNNMDLTWDATTITFDGVTITA